MIRGVWVSLTEQQRRVMTCVAHGRTYSQTAAALGVQPGTVRDYVSQVLDALGVDGQTAAVALLVQAGVIRVGSG